MKKLVISFLIILLLFFLANSCRTTIENEDYLKKLYLNARILNWTGDHEQALKLYDSLQIQVREEIFKRHSKRDYVRLSDLNTHTWIEIGRILRKEGHYESAIKCFNRAIMGDFQYDYEIYHISWDPVVEAFMELATTYKQMGDTTEVEWYMRAFNKILQELLNKE